MSFYGNARQMDRNGSTAEREIPVTPEGLAAYLEAQGLNWQVRMIRERHPITGAPLNSWATMRESDQRIFKTGFSARYVPLQHTEAFDGIATMAQLSPGMTLARAASFDGGRIVFAQADLGEMHIGNPLRDGRPDTVKRRLTFATSHDGSGSMVVSVTPFRIECKNTLTAAVGKSADDRISIRHTQSGEDRLRALAETYEVAQGQLRRTEATFQALANRKVTKGDVADLLETLFPTKDEKDLAALKRIKDEQRETLEFFGNADNGQTERDTAWNMYNAFTRKTNHADTVRVIQGDFDKPTPQEAREKSRLFGTIHDKNAEALAKLTKTLNLDSDIDRILAAVDTRPLIAVKERERQEERGSMADRILSMIDLTPTR